MVTKNWEWQVHCELCGFKRGWMKSHKIAQAWAFIHTLFRHPFGYVTVSAREEVDSAKNSPARP